MFHALININWQGEIYAAVAGPDGKIDMYISGAIHRFDNIEQAVKAYKEQHHAKPELV